MLEQILIIVLFFVVAYLLGIVFRLHRQVEANNWSTERHYEWLQLISVDLAEAQKEYMIEKNKSNSVVKPSLAETLSLAPDNAIKMEK